MIKKVQQSHCLETEAQHLSHSATTHPQVGLRVFFSAQPRVPGITCKRSFSCHNLGCAMQQSDDFSISMQLCNCIISKIFPFSRKQSVVRDYLLRSFRYFYLKDLLHNPRAGNNYTNRKLKQVVKISRKNQICTQIDENSMLLRSQLFQQIFIVDIVVGEL